MRVRNVELSWLTKLMLILALAVCPLYATSAYSASKTLLVLGDSLSAEYGLARGSGWVPLLDRRLKEKGYPATIVNASISGETTSGGLARLPALLKAHHPNIVIIELGANDGLRGLPISAMQRNLDTMIKAAKKASSKVLVVGIRLPSNYGATYTKKFESVFDKIVQDNKVPMVPFLLQGVSDHPELFQQDRLHPTANAQPIMLNNVWPHLEPMLAK